MRNILYIAISLVIVVLLFFIPIVVFDISMRIIKPSHNYWVLENGIFISKILGWVFDIIFVVIILNTRIIRLLDNLKP